MLPRVERVSEAITEMVASSKIGENFPRFTRTRRRGSYGEGTSTGYPLEQIFHATKEAYAYYSYGSYPVSVDESYWCGEFQPATSSAPPTAPRMPETQMPQ